MTIDNMIDIWSLELARTKTLGQIAKMMEKHEEKLSYPVRLQIFKDFTTAIDDNADVPFDFYNAPGVTECHFKRCEESHASECVCLINTSGTAHLVTKEEIL